MDEDQSRTTLESIRAVASAAARERPRDAVFVSDRPHMLRVLRMAADDGITAWGSPTRDEPDRARSWPARSTRRSTSSARWPSTS